MISAKRICHACPSHPLFAQALSPVQPRERPPRRLPAFRRAIGAGQYCSDGQSSAAVLRFDVALARRSCRSRDRLLMRSILLAAFAFTSWSASSQVPTNLSFEARARALDGDTVAVDFRLLGVDAFERRQMCERRGSCWQCGKAAQDFAANMLRAKTADIKLTPSSTYGRPVAIVTVDGKDLGEMLIRAGLAIPEAQYLRDDPQRAKRYAAAFSQAKTSRAGAFAGRWIEPSNWRRGERLQCER